MLMQDLTKRAVILSAVPVTPALSAYLQPGDTVVACDAGYRNAAVLGIQPDLIVGDFDSAPKPETTGDMIILPHVKDDTDTHYAAKWLCERGYRHIVMLGALGGKRMEHTFSNVSTALYLASNGVDVTLADEHSELHILCPGKPLTLQKKDPKPETTGDMIILPHVKDDTDTHYAAKWLCERGYRHIVMLGALGGKRMEHTFSNVSTALYLASNGVDVTLADEHSELHILCPGKPLTLQKKDWMYLSVFPLDGPLGGVSIHGVFYPLKDATLTPDYPLGISNEFTAPEAELCCQSGHGLVILTRADG